MSQLEHIEAIEQRLWSAADTLRANFTYTCTVPCELWFLAARRADQVQS